MAHVHRKLAPTNRVWDIRIALREGMDGDQIAGSRQLVSLRTNDASGGAAVGMTVERMLDSILRMTREREGGER